MLSDSLDLTPATRLPSLPRLVRNALSVRSFSRDQLGPETNVGAVLSGVPKFCRPDQANRATAGTSASSKGVVHRTGRQGKKAGLRRSGKGFGLGPAYTVLKKI